MGFADVCGGGHLASLSGYLGEMFPRVGECEPTVEEVTWIILWDENRGRG